MESARLFAFKIRYKHRLSSLTMGLYTAVALIFLSFFYGSFWLLFKESPVQLPRIVQMISYYRLDLDPFMLLGAALLAGLWVKRAPCVERRPVRRSFPFPSCSQCWL
jgi:hypothetical protein